MLNLDLSGVFSTIKSFNLLDSSGCALYHKKSFGFSGYTTNRMGKKGCTGRFLLFRGGKEYEKESYQEKDHRHDDQPGNAAFGAAFVHAAAEP